MPPIERGHVRLGAPFAERTSELTSAGPSRRVLVIECAVFERCVPGVLCGEVAFLFASRGQERAEGKKERVVESKNVLLLLFLERSALSFSSPCSHCPLSWVPFSTLKTCTPYPGQTSRPLVLGPLVHS